MSISTGEIVEVVFDDITQGGYEVWYDENEVLKEKPVRCCAVGYLFYASSSYILLVSWKTDDSGYSHISCIPAGALVSIRFIDKRPKIVDDELSNFLKKGYLMKAR